MFVPFLFPGGVFLRLHFKCIWNGTFSNLQKAYGGGIMEEGLTSSSCRPPRLGGGRTIGEPTAPLETGPGRRGRAQRLCLAPGAEELGGFCFCRTHKSSQTLAPPYPSCPGNSSFVQTLSRAPVSAWKHSSLCPFPSDSKGSIPPYLSYLPSKLSFSTKLSAPTQGWNDTSPPPIIFTFPIVTPGALHLMIFVPHKL